MRHTNYKIEEIFDPNDPTVLLDISLTKESVRMLLDAHEQLLQQAESVLSRACKIRGETCWCERVIIENGSIIGSGDDYCRGCYMGTEYSTCPVEYLWMDNWEDRCRKDHEAAVQKKKDEEAAEKAKEKRRHNAQERAEFLRLQKKFGGGDQ